MSNIEEIKEIKEVDEETLRNLIQQILDNPEKFPTEAKLILILETWYRQGPSYDDYKEYDIIEGDVREVTLETWDEGYPYRVGRKVALIPLTLPVIVEERSYADNVSPTRSSKFVHIFTSDGWKTVRVY